MLRSCEFSDAVNTISTHIKPINGNETTDSQSRVLIEIVKNIFYFLKSLVCIQKKTNLRLPKPRTCSFKVKAALTDTNSIRRLMTDITAMGPTNHQTTFS